MDRINAVYDVMHWASLDENVICMRPYPKWTATILFKCDELQIELLTNVANRPKLSLKEKNIVEKTHNAIAEARRKYQNDFIAAAW